MTTFSSFTPFPPLATLSIKADAVNALWDSYNKSYFEAARSPKKRSLPGVNEHFSGKADAERALLDSFSFSGKADAVNALWDSYNKSYFEAARSPKKRSLPGVNEHFSGKADAERALLDESHTKTPAILTE